MSEWNEEQLRTLAASMPMNGDLVFGTVMGLYGVLMIYLRQLPRSELDNFLEKFSQEIDQWDVEVEGISAERMETVNQGVRLGLVGARKMLEVSTTRPDNAATEDEAATARHLRFRMDANATVPLPPRGSLRQRAIRILTRLSGQGVSGASAAVCLLLYLSSTVPLVPEIPHVHWFLWGFFAFAGFAALKSAAIEIADRLIVAKRPHTIEDAEERRDS